MICLQWYQMTKSLTPIRARISNYLSGGGMWNPESMEHYKVRDLLIDCLEVIEDMISSDVDAKRQGTFHKYNEPAALADLASYIDTTYNQHYSTQKYQATEFIIDGGHGVGFCVGNIMKYAQRYGKKNGFNRADIMKILHYAIILLHVHDTKNSEVTHEDQ